MRESSPGPTASLERAIDLARDALADAPAGLITDFDGTLSPIVADPASARLVEGAAPSLTALAERLAVVAVVTGRAPLDVRRLTGVPGVLVAGNHGTEWLEPDAGEPVVSAAADEARRGVAAALERVPSLPGVSVEDKGVSATVHYRAAPDPEAARRVVLEAIGEPPVGVELRPGKMSVEIRPVGLGDKGAATQAIIERFGLRGVVVLGDDVTDLDMFRAADEARRAGTLRAALVGVGGDGAETPPEVAATADVVLATPEQVARLLTALASGLGSG